MCRCLRAHTHIYMLNSVADVFVSQSDESMLSAASPSAQEQLHCTLIMSLVSTVLRGRRVLANDDDVLAVARLVLTSWSSIAALDAVDSHCADRARAFLATARLASVVSEQSLATELLSCSVHLSDDKRAAAQLAAR